MGVTNLYFRGQMEGEELISFTRKHWLSLLADIVPYFLYLSVLIVFFAMSGQFKLPSLSEPFFQVLIILGLMTTGFLTHRFFLHMINHFLNVIIVTNFRIVEIRKTVFLRHIVESIDMKKIQDLQMTQDGLIKNLLKCGNIHIILGNTE